MPLSGSRRTEALSGLPRRPRRWRIRLAWLISLLIHVVVVLLLLVTIRREEKPEQLPPPSAVTMLFDTGRKQGPTLPNPSLQATPPGAPAPPSPPVALPLPPVEPPPSPPPTRPAKPVPPPVAAPPPPVTTEPQPPAPSPPAAKPQPPPLPKMEPEPLPVPPPAQPGSVPKPPPIQPPASLPKPPKPPAFPAPMNYSFGTPLTASSSPGRLRSRPHIPGTIDMSLGPAARGAADNTPLSKHDKEAQGADWRNALSNWVAQHAYYPNEARRQGEEGDAEVRVVASPNGRVRTVELIGKSGSMWLDLALLALFRDQQLPPLPYGSKDALEFNFTMHYVLIRPR